MTLRLPVRIEAIRPPRADADDASPTLAKCLPPRTVARRAENMVNETLTEHVPKKWEAVFRKGHAPDLKRRCREPMAGAMGADDQGGGIARGKALRLDVDPVIGWGRWRQKEY